MSRSNKRYIMIIFVSWLAYLISYLGRNDYGACMLEIITDTGISRASAGMISSAFALCNAIGQLVSTVIINRVSALKLITVEIFTVAVINLLFPITDSFPLMLLLWGINGAMQATLLCGITRIFSETLEEPWLSRGAVSMNTIGAVGGMVNYLLSPLLIRFFDWKTVFFTMATLLFLIGMAWCMVMPRLTARTKKMRIEENAPKAVTQRPEAIWRIITTKGAICAIVAAFFIGSLRESVLLWVPSYVNESFQLSVAVSTALTAWIPMLQIFGALLAGRIGRSSKNLFVPALVSFLISGVCFVTMPLIDTFHVAITVAMFVLNAICMTAALTFLLSLYPIRSMERKNIARFVGILNFFVHLGDFVASTGFGWLSSVGGWSLTFLVMAAFVFIAAMIALVGIYAHKKGGSEYVEV